MSLISIVQDYDKLSMLSQYYERDGAHAWYVLSLQICWKHIFINKYKIKYLKWFHKLNKLLWIFKSFKYWLCLCKSKRFNINQYINFVLVNNGWKGCQWHSHQCKQGHNLISKTIGVWLSSFKNNCCMQLLDLNQ